MLSELVTAQGLLPPTVRTQSVFKRFAERGVAFGHLWRYIAMLEERQNPIDPGGTVNRLVSLFALRSGALTS
jgi:hypothetical protein